MAKVIQLKSRPEVPPTLVSEEVLAFVESLKERVAAGEVLKSKDFEGKYWRKDDVKQALFEMHSGKCCYCERKRDKKREPDVEHFRPKAGVTEDADHPGYWWLAYDWENYFFSCKKCNQEHKKTQFPLLMNGRSRAYTFEDSLDEEKPFFINPEKENPEKFIGFEWRKAWGVYVKAIGLDDELRGYTTIKSIGLNEGTIPQQRAEIVDILQELVGTMHVALRRGPERAIERTAKLIRKETLSEREFAGFRRAFFENAGFSEYVSDN